MEKKLFINKKSFGGRNVALVTGGLGFIGRALIQRLLENPDVHVINLDVVTYAAAPELLDLGENESRYTFIQGSVTDDILVQYIIDTAKPHYVFHMAAESHNSNAAASSKCFWETNATGSAVVYSCIWRAVEAGYMPKKIVHMATCEVYGDKPIESTDMFVETDSLNPNTSYNNSKASGDREAQIFAKRGLPVVIARPSNIFGPGQDPEKVIPAFIRRVLHGEKIPVYDSYTNYREWTYLSDAVDALIFLADSAAPGIYNITSYEKRNVMEIAQKILLCAGLSNKAHEYISIVKARPEHDRGYPLNAAKINAFGWKPKYTFEQGFEETFKWNKDNIDWLDKRIALGRIDEFSWGKK